MDPMQNSNETQRKKAQNIQPMLQSIGCNSDISGFLKTDQPTSCQVSSPSLYKSSSSVCVSLLPSSSSSNVDGDQVGEVAGNNLKDISLHQQLTVFDHNYPAETNQEVNKTDIDEGVPKLQRRFEDNVHLTKITGDSVGTNCESKRLEEQNFAAEEVGKDDEKKTYGGINTHQPKEKHSDNYQLSDTDSVSSNNIVPCGGLEGQQRNSASSLRKVQVMENQAAVCRTSTDVRSDDKQIQELLETGRQHLSCGNKDLAWELVTSAYNALGRMAGNVEDTVIAEGYDACSDLFFRLGRIGAAIRSFYRGVEYQTNWEPNYYKIKAVGLWTLMLGTYTPFLERELELLRQELETISENLENKKIWERCLVVSSGLFGSYTYSDCNPFRTRDTINAGMKKSALRMAVCTYQMKNFQVAITQCKFVLEEICDYDCLSALLLWSSSLKEMKKYDTALKKAESALGCCKSTEDRQKVQNLISELQNKLDQQEEQNGQDSSEWLVGTNVGKDVEEKRRAEDAKSTNIRRPKRHRPKRKEKSPEPFDTSGSKTTSAKGGDSAQSSTHESLEFSNTSKLIYDSPSSNKESLGNELDISSSHSEINIPVRSRNSRRRRQRHLSRARTRSEGNVAISSSTHSVPQQRTISLNIEHDDSIHWSESDDEHINCSSDNIYSNFDSSMEDLQVEEQTNIDSTEESYFERSRLFFSEQNDINADETINIVTMLQKGLKLDEDFLRSFNDRSQQKNFYEDELSEEEVFRKRKEHPNRYKECILQIESSHVAYCTPLNQNDNIRKIEIHGRTKAGQAFSGDRVWVEVIKREERVTQEGKTFGKIIRTSQRNRNGNIKHPIYVCTMDDMESHLMRPICKTLPKIHVLNKKVKKFKVEIYKYNSVSEKLEFQKLIHVSPEARNSHVFLVVYIGWTRRHQYPRGAVIKVLPCAEDLEAGIRLLDIQFEVPGLYNFQTVKRVESVMSRNLNAEPTDALKTGRKDLTGLRIFTIDPPNSKDLDDSLSIEKVDGRFRVGVHISDVTAYVQKGDPVDMEAQQRSTTFYSGVRSPHHMLPEPLSQNLCSLLPGKRRLCISVFFYMSKDGEVVEQPLIEKSIISSSRRLNYREVQDIINENSTESDQGIQNDIHILLKLATLRRKRRLGNSMYAMHFECEEEVDEDSLSETFEAHYLVEEFMVLANTIVAGILLRKFPNLIPLRCQNPPPEEELQRWLKRQDKIVDLLVFLQDRRVADYRTVSLAATQKLNSKNLVAVQQKVYETLTSENSSKILKYMRTDELHPLQCLARQEWLKIQEYADYRCSGSLKNKSKEGKHYSLEMFPYTHFTSPIRRYVDQIVHRLLHCVIDGKEAVYTQKEVEEYCLRINTIAQKAKSYQKNCKSLSIAEKLKLKPTSYYCIIDDVTEMSVNFCSPALGSLQRSARELPFSLLDISSKPIFKKDTHTDREIVTVEWQKRLYNAYGSSSSVKREISRIDPNQHVVYVPKKDWVRALHSTFKGNATEISDALKNITPGLYNMPSSYDTVEDVSTETRDSTMMQPYSRFSTSFSYGQVVKVQMTAIARKGILTPYPQIFDVTKNVKCCLQHADDPVKWLCRYSTKPTMERYDNVNEYLDRWLPLVLMEAATTALENEGGFTINNLPVRFSEVKGQFRLKTEFCFERNIEISGRETYDLLEETDEADDSESQEENAITSHDWLCIRHAEPAVHESLAPSFIRVTHAQITNVRKRKRGDEISVDFQIHPLSSFPENVRVERCAVELLMKSDVDRRTEIYLKCLNKATELAKRIALNKKIPYLEKDHLRLAERLISKDDLNVGTLPKNNRKQREAITKALTSRFSLIQGPPGTGKSYAGIKLLYHFDKINKSWEREGNTRKQVLFCGPSNKSVDQVTKWMLKKLKEHCPNIVRMYGRSIEAVEFPIPGKTFLSKRSMRESKAAKDIADVSLHHLIRKKGKKYAEEINALDRKFGQPNYVFDYMEVKNYIHILKLATIDELKRHDVILCTTAVASNAKLLEGTDIYQIIIDEAAMCPEPQCMVPIIATKAEQVVLIGDHKQLQPIIKCREAAELGLKKSLFERYALSESLERNNVEYTLLEFQYRMNPQLCAFPSNEFYEGKLETRSSYLWEEGLFINMWLDQGFPHVLCHIEGKEEVLANRTDEGNEQSRSNKAEVEQIVKIFLHMVRKEGVKSNRINVVSQYNAQCHELREALRREGFVDKKGFDVNNKNKVNVNTVVASQGGEWDYVLFSTVRSLPEYMIERNPTLGWCKQKLGFITDYHQINVALTRARKGIVIVGNRNLLQCDEVWRRLINEYENKGCVTTAAQFPRKRHQKHKRKNNRSMEMK
ncbi:hypothetical protein ACJMK2_041302 [Sinanodonta woodiana]|uniref:RNB domain-containing protein n=1 Tax=Sinanodonta woodiana TaxID=1069815 RepID=A0ABD3W4B9_SINWO